MDHPLYSERERYGMEDESGSGETHEELVLDALGTFLNHQQHRAPARDVSPVITAGREAQRRIIEQLGWDSETERHEESFKTRAFTSSGDNGEFPGISLSSSFSAQDATNLRQMLLLHRMGQLHETPMDWRTEIPCPKTAHPLCGVLLPLQELRNRPIIHPCRHLFSMP